MATRLTGRKTKLLGRATTRHARELKEAWHSIDKNTINRHIDIPTVYLQLKQSDNLTTSSLHIQSSSSDINSAHATQDTPGSMATHSTTSNQPHAPPDQPIRRSRRLQQLNKQREYLNSKTV